MDLSGWQLQGGISFTFPSGTSLTADGYLVVARSAAQLLGKYTNLTSANTLGDFQGKLAGSGERIALAKPDTILVRPAAGAAQTNVIQIVVDEVTYGTGGPLG